ncbi:TPA: hypothetical protein ACX6QP_002103 [Photobacterium damselae]
MELKQIMAAWIVSNPITGRSCVVFQNTEEAAAEKGRNILQARFEVTCSRSPIFDGYAKYGKVPTNILLQQGWEFGCYECGCNVSYEHHVLDDIVIIERDGEADTVYCSSKCIDTRLNRLAAVDLRFDEFKSQVQSGFPFVSFTRFTGGYPSISCVAQFTFLGAHHGGTITDLKGDGELSLYISSVDIDKWNELITSRNLNKDLIQK